MKTLKELADLHGTDKAVSFLNYPPLYDALFTPIRDRQLKILEIGVQRGKSLRMWYDYFPNAHIYGYDILKARRLRRFNRDRITTFSGDQSKREDLNRFIQAHGGDFDIIIDDGSHVSDHQFISLGSLFYYLKKNGWYFVEDLQAELAQKFKQIMKSFMETGRLKAPILFPHEVQHFKLHVSDIRFIDEGEKLLLISKGEQHAS